MLGVHCGGSTLGSDTSVSSRYLFDKHKHPQMCLLFLIWDILHDYVTIWASRTPARVA